MKKTNVKCPLCGTINRNLYLEETDGWMECERCGSITKGIVCTAKISIPVLQHAHHPETRRSPGFLREPA